MKMIQERQSESPNFPALTDCPDSGFVELHFQGPMGSSLCLVGKVSNRL